MEWILDHLQFLIVAGAAIAWWLNKRREGIELQHEAEEQLAQPETRQAEMDDAERARRIQEEIRRKITQRRTLPPVARPVVVQEWSRQQRAPMEPPPMLSSAMDVGASIREQQRQIQEKLRIAAETRKRAAAMRAQLSPISSVATSAPRYGPVTGLKASLRNRSEVRRAIVLREILGTPKGLQL